MYACIQQALRLPRCLIMLILPRRHKLNRESPTYSTRFISRSSSTADFRSSFLPRSERRLVRATLEPFRAADFYGVASCAADRTTESRFPIGTRRIETSFIVSARIIPPGKLTSTGIHTDDLSARVFLVLRKQALSSQVHEGASGSRELRAIPSGSIPPLLSEKIAEDRGVNAEADG